MDMYEANNVTIQWSTISESATQGHPEGQHNYGLINVTFFFFDVLLILERDLMVLDLLFITICLHITETDVLQLQMVLQKSETTSSIT